MTAAPTGTMPTYGSKTELGPIPDQYRPAAPSQQEPTESPMREILKLMAQRRSAPPDQKFHLIRDELIEWRSALAGLDPFALERQGYSSDERRQADYFEDMNIVRYHVDFVLSLEDPAADYPVVEFEDANQSHPHYVMSKGKGTPESTVGVEHYDAAVNKRVELEGAKKYLQALDQSLIHYAPVREIAAKWGLWDWESELHPTTAAYSMKNIRRAIQDSRHALDRPKR